MSTYEHTVTRRLTLSFKLLDLFGHSESSSQNFNDLCVTRSCDRARPLTPLRMQTFQSSIPIFKPHRFLHSSIRYPHEFILEIDCCSPLTPKFPCCCPGRNLNKQYAEAIHVESLLISIDGSALGFGMPCRDCSERSLPAARTARFSDQASSIRSRPGKVVPIGPDCLILGTRYYGSEYLC